MESTSVLNISELVSPIEGDVPTGSDLRLDADPNNVYRRLKEARKQASQAERQNEPVDEFWNTILSESPGAIATVSKDLEIVAWLVEALVRAHGFAGLRDGFRLTRELIDHHWEHLYPPYDEDDGYLIRVAAFSSLSGDTRDGTLIRPIRQIPFTDSPPFSHADVIEAKQLDSIDDPDRRSQMIESGVPTLDEIQKAVDSGSSEFLREVVSDLKVCQEELGALSSLFMERCGNTPSGDPAYPSLTNIRTVLEEYYDSLRPYIGGLEEEPENEGEGENATEAGGTPGAAGRNARDSGEMTRDQAFRQLLSIADYFRRTEPHSPISYAVEQVVRWGRLSLPDLWSELISDESGRRDAFRLVGIKRDEDDESGEF